MAGVAENIINMLGKSMQNWKTHLQVNNSTLGVVDIKRGIFQGGSFSPLIFVITLIPLMMTLKKVKQGYCMKKGMSKVNNLLLSLVSTGDLARQECWITTNYDPKSQWKHNIFRGKPINTPREVRLEKIKKF